VYDGADKETKLRLSTNKTEVSTSLLVRAPNQPLMRLIADNVNNPTTGDDMGVLRFSRNFEDPLALDLARAIFNDFSNRVIADGGTVEGSEECVATELELIVAGEYLINMAEVRAEYTGSLNSTKSDMVFYVNNGGIPVEKMRITSDGELIATEIDGGTF